MSRGDQNLDELFKNAFQPQEHEVVPAYWQEAKQMINASKVAKTPFYLKPFFITGAVIVTASISAILFFGSTPEKQATENMSVEIQSDNTSLLASNTKQEDLKTSTNPITTKDLNSSKKENTKSISASAATNLDNSVSKPSSTEKTNTQNKTSIPNAFAKEWASTSIIASSHPTQSQANKNTTEEVLPNQKVSVSYSKNLNSPTPTNTSNKSSLKEESTPSYTLKTEIPSIPFLEPKPWSTLSSEEDFVNGQNFKETKHKKLFNPFSVRLSAGALWEGQNSSTSNLITSKSQEQNMEFSVEYLFHKGWGVQSGISWNQQQTIESFSYLNEVDNSYWTTEEYINPVTNRVWWLGDWYYYPTTYDTTYEDVYVLLKDSVEQNTKLESKMTLIEVPILLTYNYAWNRMNIQIASGVSLGTLVNASGSYFSSSDPFAQEIKSNKDFAPIQTSFLFHSEFGYGLNSNWWLTARPQIKWNLNSIAPQNATISPKVFYYGINAGLMYRF